MKSARDNIRRDRPDRDHGAAAPLPAVFSSWAAKRGGLDWAAAPLSPERVRLARARRGAENHQAGLAAEDAVARLYARQGGAVIARRWRGPEGEIDLIVRERDALVFVEVKRRRRPVIDDPVGERQWRRLEATALRYMMEAETGDAPMRFDLALVGADGVTEVTRNARC